jgi:serine/threonine protein kinase
MGKIALINLVSIQITGVACGLKYLHSKGVVHGDLKSVRPYVVYVKL